MKYTKDPAGRPFHLADFPSLSGFIDFALRFENGPARIGKNPVFDSFLENTEKERDFSFGMNTTKAMQLLQDPPPAAGLIKTLAETLNLSTHDQPRRRLRRGLEDGAELDPAAWINRRPDGWEDIRKERTAKRIYRLAINIVTASTETPQHLAARSACALAIIDAAERAGHRAELDGLICLSGLDNSNSRKNGEDQVIRIRLKNAESPADLDTLALAAGELGFFRSMGFRGIIACYNGEANLHSGLGGCIPAPATLRADYDLTIDRNQVYDEATAAAFLCRFETGLNQEDPAA